MTTVELEIPGLRLQGENWWRRSHPHWLLAKQRNGEKAAVSMLFAASKRHLPKMAAPFVVKLTRVSPSTRGLDSDGLQGAFKYVRDTIAKQLGIDDGDQLAAAWLYDQERGPWGVRVRVEGGGA